jgi:hypothetical protein
MNSEATQADTGIYGTTKRQVPAMLAGKNPRLQPLVVDPFWATTMSSLSP